MFGLTSQKIIEILVSFGITVLVSILAKIIYNLYGYITIIKKYLPKAMTEAEKNFPEGHGDFKENYVIANLTNICHKRLISPNKKLFKYLIHLFVVMSKNLNVVSKIRAFFGNLEIDEAEAEENEKTENKAENGAENNDERAIH